MTEENETINKAREVWQPYYDEELSSQELGEITHNFVSLVNLLNSWKQKEACEVLGLEEFRSKKNDEKA